MKTQLTLGILGITVLALSFQGKMIKSDNKPLAVTSDKIEYPQDVKQVIDNKCFGCHNPDSKAQKAKDALDWTALRTLDKAKQISKLDKIIEMLNKGKMPPKKFIEHKPEAKISDAESKILKDWAQATADNLLK